MHSLSRIKIKRSAKELNLSNSDLQLLLDFKVEESDEPKKLENPDGEWYFDEACVPNGWKMKMYSYNSKLNNKVLEVFHYLTPDSLVLRGKKQVYDYMVKNIFKDVDRYPHVRVGVSAQVGLPA